MAVFAGAGETDIDAYVNDTGGIQAQSGVLGLNGGGTANAGDLYVAPNAVVQFGTMAATGTGGTFVFDGGPYIGSHGGERQHGGPVGGLRRVVRRGADGQFGRAAAGREFPMGRELRADRRGSVGHRHLHGGRRRRNSMAGWRPAAGGPTCKAAGRSAGRCSSTAGGRWRTTGH